MRQFVFGLLVAGLIWWGYGRATLDAGARSDAGANGAVPARGAAGTTLDQLLVDDGSAHVPADQPAPAVTSQQPLAAGGSQNAQEAEDVAPLLAQLEARAAPACARAWAWLATGRAGRDAARLRAALASAGDDFASCLAVLGDDNSFLHSAEGRAAAEKALAAAIALPDPDAVAAGTRLLALMARGRIERGDTAARQAVDQAYRQHRIRVDRWLCNPANVAGARSYTVAAGDSLARIATKFRKEGIETEAGTIAVLNGVRDPNALQVGQSLKIPVAKVNAVVEKRSFAMMVFVGDQLLRLYWIGHGANDRTPVTEFVVGEKQPRPQWTAPDGNVYPYGHPQNILGEYFIKFRHPQYSGFGAHGTPMPDTICTMSSMGCIRMLAADIAELFQLLPRGARVIVLANESLRG